MTNILLILVVSTNWIAVSGDFKREDGTNFVKQRLAIVTNIYVQEVTLCTNRTLFQTTTSTNGETRWAPAPTGFMLPPSPAFNH